MVVALGKDEKFKCTIVFFLDFSAFLLLFIYFLAFYFFLLLWDENPNGTSVPYLFLKIKRKF